MKKKLQELEEFNLAKNLKKVLDEKRKDPSRRTAFKNIESVKKNARLKILRQLKFSNKHGLKFENQTDIDFFKAASGQEIKEFPDILQNERFASQLEAMDAQSIPEETQREQDKQSKTGQTTARYYEPLASTKYGTSNSMTEKGSHLPEGVK